LIKLVVSDLHVGTGSTMGRFNPFEDFHYDRQFRAFSDHFCAPPFADTPVELILAGDIFDLLKTEVDGSHPDQITEEVALYKLTCCLNGHPEFLAALRSFVSAPERSITYMMGNHDLEIAFPRVQEFLRSAVGGPDHRDRVRFVVYEPYYELPGGVRIYHGNQFEALNSVNPRKLFITEGVPAPCLNLPWGSVFLLKVLLPFKEQRPYINLVQPFSRYLQAALVTDTAFAVPLAVKATYYFMKTRFLESRKRAGDLRSTLRILMEEAVVYRDFETQAFEIMRKEPRINAVIMGHSHVPMIRRGAGDRLYVNVGTWTKLINLRLPELGVTHRRTYVRLDYPDGPSTPQIGLYQWHGRPSVAEEILY
jgi:UDP-2,3-diacylglucosamine pyrophosphatase LpxH